MKVLHLFGLTALIMLLGCSPSDKSLDNAQKRIDILRSKGVPDTSLSSPKVLLYQAREAKRISNHSLAWQSAKAARTAIAEAEATYENNLPRLKAETDSILSVASAVEQQLSGLQKHKLDSMKIKVDSFITINWMLQAHAKAVEIAGSLQQLKADEELSKTVRGVIPGIWVCETVIKGQDNKAVHAVEKKIFEFGKDGKIKLTESGLGQNGPVSKEDYEFLSYGTYDCKGDTIVLFVKRFNAVRQIMEKYLIEGTKKYWKKEPGPTYDSTITDGSQDRFVTYSDLKLDFKQEKKY